jgi:hypothetical protein
MIENIQNVERGRKNILLRIELILVYEFGRGNILYSH